MTFKIGDRVKYKENKLSDTIYEINNIDEGNNLSLKGWGGFYAADQYVLYEEEDSSWRDNIAVGDIVRAEADFEVREISTDGFWVQKVGEIGAACKYIYFPKSVITEIAKKKELPIEIGSIVRWKGLHEPAMKFVVLGKTEDGAIWMRMTNKDTNELPTYVTTNLRNIEAVPRI